jgi:membrane-associated protease RseP (regulator of RpoE activity)
MPRFARSRSSTKIPCGCLTSFSRATANATPASARSGPGATAESLSAKLGELLGVPAGARIVAVDGAPVQSPQEVIDKVVPLLGSAAGSG